MNLQKGCLFVLLTALVSGVSIFLNKFAVAGINPYVFTFSKNAVVVLFLFSLLLAFRDFKVFRELTKMHWLKLVLIGFFGGSIPFLLFFKGLSMSSGAVSALLHKSMFIPVTILAVIFLREKLHKGFIAAALLLFAGNLILLKSASFSFGIADLLVILAVLLWSVEIIISKHVLNEIPSRVVAFGRMFFGAVFILVFLVMSGNIAGMFYLSLPQVGWILFTSVLLLLYVVTWYAGLSYMPASLAAALLVFGSAVTTVLSFGYSGIFNVGDMLAVFFILAGVIAAFGSSFIMLALRKFFPSRN